MEQLQADGLARAIGVSNFYPDRLVDLIERNEETPGGQPDRDAPVLPAPRRPRGHAGTWVQLNPRSFAEGRNDLFSDPTLTAIGDAHGKSSLRSCSYGSPQREDRRHPEVGAPGADGAELRRLRLRRSTDEDLERIATMDTGASLFFDHRDPTMVEVAERPPRPERDPAARATGASEVVSSATCEHVAMSSVGGRHVEAAVAEMVAVLMPRLTLDWQAPAGSLEWSCWTTAAHVAHDLASYAGQVAARATAGYLPFDLVIAPEAAPREVSGGGLRLRSTPEHMRSPAPDLVPLRGTGGCQTQRASRRWASRKRSCTPTTSRRVSAWPGFRLSRSVSWSSLGSFPMHHPGARRRSCSGPRVERISRATLASASGSGEPLSPEHGLDPVKMAQTRSRPARAPSALDPDVAQVLRSLHGCEAVHHRRAGRSDRVDRPDVAPLRPHRPAAAHRSNPVGLPPLWQRGRSTPVPHPGVASARAQPEGHRRLVGRDWADLRRAIARHLAEVQRQGR